MIIAMYKQGFKLRPKKQEHVALQTITQPFNARNGHVLDVNSSPNVNALDSSILKGIADDKLNLALMKVFAINRKDVL